MPEVCGSCLQVVEDGYPGGDDVETAIMFCVEMGKDIEDHLCDARETDREVNCDCQCNR